MKKPIRGAWYKASASAPNDNCVEVFHGDDVVRMRDSKAPTAAVLSFSLDEWAAFQHGMKNGEFDRP